MSKILIHQPEYLPWINLFIKMNYAEKFIFLDNVQYSRRSFQNRNLLPSTKNNKKNYITVPIQKAPFNESINRIKIDYSEKWIDNHLEKMRENYRKSEFFDEVFKLIINQLNINVKYLCDLNENLLKLISKESKINCEFVKASQLKVKGNKSDLILNICKKLEAKTYITGTGSINYLDQKIFEKNNIRIKILKPVVQNFQFESQNINPNYSIIDFLFKCGFKNLKKYLSQNA